MFVHATIHFKCNGYVKLLKELISSDDEYSSVARNL